MSAAALSLIFCLLLCVHLVIGSPHRYESVSKGATAAFPRPHESHRDHWISLASDRLRSKISRKDDRKAKNIIFFLGDGMSLATVTAARIFQGQLQNRSGEEGRLFFESFPFSGLSKTYCADSQVADSACSGTAYMTGVKANIATIGVTSQVTTRNCREEIKAENQVSSLIAWAQQAGKHTGIITTARVTHATPAAGYAHTSYRDHESDSNINRKKATDPDFCKDIASQLVFNEPGKNLKVIMGGGRVKFLPELKKDPIYESINGSRSDGIDLIEKWKEDKANQKARANVVYTRDQLDKVNISETDYLLALFEPSHMKYHLQSDPRTDPSLSYMTKKSIEMLKKSPNGFVLFVEGAKIDLAHHKNMAMMALGETLEFAKAIEVASNMTDPADTLIVVTADHSHVMTINGYPERGSDILKISLMDDEKFPYTTLSYANGPGFHAPVDGKPYNLTGDNFGNPKYQYPSMVKLAYETHGGDDVPVYAQGPGSYLFTGVFEQNYIPIAEAYAANIGPYVKPDHDISSSGVSVYSPFFISALLLCFISVVTTTYYSVCI